MLKNQTRSSTNQIKNLITSTLKSTSMRRGSHFDDNTPENNGSSKQLHFEARQAESSGSVSFLPIKKKTTAFLIEESDQKISPFIERKASNEEDNPFKESKYEAREFFLNGLESLEKRISQIGEDDELPQIPRRITYDGCKRKKEEGGDFIDDFELFFESYKKNR